MCKCNEKEGQERRTDGESGKRKVLLTDHQRRIATEFERKSKELGSIEQNNHASPENAEIKTKVKKAFDKARADLWGMLTAMKKGLIDAQDKIFHLEKENKRLRDRVLELEGSKDDL
jgi:hypothetical protein